MAARIQQSPQPGGGNVKARLSMQAKRARRWMAVAPPAGARIQGILITCNMNERKCVEEAYSLLNEYGDDMYGPEKVPVPGRAGLEGEGEGWQASCVNLAARVAVRRRGLA